MNVGLWMTGGKEMGMCGSNGGRRNECPRPRIESGACMYIITRRALDPDHTSSQDIHTYMQTPNHQPPHTHAYIHRARPGGYTRVMKLQRYRPGDAADMSLIEFVGRCVPVPWAGRRAAASHYQSSVACDWPVRVRPLTYHHPRKPQPFLPTPQARGAAAGAAGEPGIEGHGPAPDATTKRSGSRGGQRMKQDRDDK